MRSLLHIASVLVLAAAAVSAETTCIGCGPAEFPAEMMETALQKFYKDTGGPTKWPAFARVKWDHPGGICAFDGDARKHGYNPFGTRCLFGGFHPPPPKGDGGVMYLTHTTGMAEGTLPAEMKSFWMINLINLADNKLSGTLYDTAHHCSIGMFSIANNQMSGTLPADAFAGSKANFWGLNLANNKFTGAIPASLTKDTEVMASLNLNDNELSGTLPDLSHLKELRHITVANNKLEGSLGPWLEHLENLAWMELDNNSFTGSLPHPPKTLSRFTADGNKFEGVIPDSWDDDESVLRYFSCKGCNLKCPEGKENMFAHLVYSTHCRDPKKARHWAPVEEFGDAAPNSRLEPFKGFQ